jgi:hypothetical protein
MVTINSTEDEELEKQIQKMLDKANPHGKNVINRIREMTKREPGFFLKRTAKGFHVCVGLRNDEIKLVQVWVDLNQPKKQVIETRRQDLPDYVYFNKEEDNEIYNIFQNAQFIPINGEYKNFTLDFEKSSGDESKILNDIDKAIVDWADAIRKMANRT